MKKHRFLRILALLTALVLLGLTGCANDSAGNDAAAGDTGDGAASETPSEGGADPAPAPAAEGAVVLTIGTNTAPSHPENLYLIKLGELVSEATDGAIVIDVKDSATLGDHLERLEGLRLGTIDGTLTSIGYLGGYNPVFNIFEMPYLFRNETHQYNVFHGEIFDRIADECPQYGFVLVGAMEMGARHITNSRNPIVTPADLEGLKVRVPETKSSMDALTAMGATPTPMAFSELYMGLQQKQVDGQENPFSNIYANKFFEVQDYLSLTGHQRVEQILLFSQISWNALSAEQQAIIMECEVAANAYLRDVIAAEEAELLGELEKEGMQINEVDQDAFIEKCRPLREQYIEEYGETARVYFEMIDATAD